MTVCPQPLPLVLEATVAAVQAAFPKGNLSVALRVEDWRACAECLRPWFVHVRTGPDGTRMSVGVRGALAPRQWAPYVPVVYGLPWRASLSQWSSTITARHGASGPLGRQRVASTWCILHSHDANSRTKTMGRTGQPGNKPDSLSCGMECLTAEVRAAWHS
jgi:hypothetical protein